jgi:hypothetical protein
MTRLGMGSLLVGFGLVIGWVTYHIVTAVILNVAMPIIIRVGMALILVGLLFLIVVLLLQKIGNKTEKYLQEVES